MISNKKVCYNYYLERGYNAGLKLEGKEVRVLRNGGGSFVSGTFCFFNDAGELYLRGLKICDERDIKCLLRKEELIKLSKSKLKGYTIVPYRLYLHNGFFKVEIYLAKGKKLYDKREEIKKRDYERRGDNY